MLHYHSEPPKKDENAGLDWDNGYGPVSQIDSPTLQFFLERHGPKQADIVMVDHGRRFVMSDERIVERDNDPESKSHQVILEPGQTYKGYDFFASPDRCWVFVVRGGFRRFAVAYLYRRGSGNNFVPVHPGGERLDNAAIRHYAKRRSWPVASFAGGGRIVRFDRWDWPRHRLEFEMYVSSDWYPEMAIRKKRPVQVGYWKASFDLRNQTIGFLREVERYK